MRILRLQQGSRTTPLDPMSQGTFWDGDEQEKLTEPELFVPAHKQEDAEPLPPKRDFRINKATTRPAPYQGENKAAEEENPFAMPAIRPPFFEGTEAFDQEARRVALELVELWQKGAISEHDRIWQPSPPQSTCSRPTESQCATSAKKPTQSERAMIP